MSEYGMKKRARQATAEEIAGCRKMASEFRVIAENRYRETQAQASRWELYANLLERGLTFEEANIRAFGPLGLREKEKVRA